MHGLPPGRARCQGPRRPGADRPSVVDVAVKYAGVPGAVGALTHTVMTGSNPYASHWKGKVSGLAMPPNEVAISEGDAHKLVVWILTLDRK